MKIDDGNHNSNYVCQNCCQYTTISKEGWEKHSKYCIAGQAVEIPEETSTLKFKNYENINECPIRIYGLELVMSFRGLARRERGVEALPALIRAACTQEPSGGINLFTVKTQKEYVERKQSIRPKTAVKWKGRKSKKLIETVEKIQSFFKTKKESNKLFTVEPKKTWRSPFQYTIQNNLNPQGDTPLTIDNFKDVFHFYNVTKFI